MINKDKFLKRIEKELKKTSQNNPFKFYTGKEYNKDNLKATREIKKEFENFTIKIRKIMEKYESIGATDTQSREEIVLHFQKKLNEGNI